MTATTDNTELLALRSTLAAAAHDARQLLTALTLTAVESPELEAAAGHLRAAAGILGSRQRTLHEHSRYDLPVSCGRAFSVGHGIGNPVSPRLEYRWEGERVEARCSLGPVYEGPKGYAHGGISALLLDDVLARVPSLLGVGRVTRELSVTYQRPIPLATPIVVTAECGVREGTMLCVSGEIRLDDSVLDGDGPSATLVSATGRFVLLRDDQLRKINPMWSPGARWPD
jgi:acyl-coenzyme A thioesterase PaaI-like protein